MRRTICTNIGPRRELARQLAPRHGALVNDPGQGSSELADRVRRVSERLATYPAGVHQLDPPARVLDSSLPRAVAAVYRALGGGGSLFFESLILAPASELYEDAGRWRVGEHDGDELWVDAGTGGVWRQEQDTGEWLEEATSFDRWLAGFVDAEELLYDRDGEFRDVIFDEAGELLPETIAARERAMLRRDRDAVAPRWRLARALTRLGQTERARDELERVVEQAPGFAWAWYDLARLAETLGDVTAARDDMRAAAEADADGSYAAFFWAHAARLAAAAGDEAGRGEAAARAFAADPAIGRGQLEGAREQFAAGDVEAARELIDTAAAVLPRDLEVMDLARQLDRSSAD